MSKKNGPIITVGPFKALRHTYFVTVKVLALLFRKKAVTTTFPVVAPAGTCTFAGIVTALQKRC